jgi:Anti-sigma factor NepR
MMTNLPHSAFAPRQADTHDALAIAQNLARLYKEVLEEPIPTDLTRLIGHLRERMGERTPRV